MSRTRNKPASMSSLNTFNEARLKAGEGLFPRPFLCLILKYNKGYTHHAKFKMVM